MGMQATDWTKKRTYPQTEIIVTWENEALYVPGQYTIDDITERVLCLPQCSEGWNFESPTGEGEGDGASWAHREKVGGNPGSQFVKIEDTGRHGGGCWRREGGFCAIRLTWWGKYQIRAGVISLFRAGNNRTTYIRSTRSLSTVSFAFVNAQMR